MRIEAKVHPDSTHIRVIDRATGEKIERVRWADTETRELAVCRTDGSGLLVVEDGEVAVDVETGCDWYLRDERTGEEYGPHG